MRLKYLLPLVLLPSASLAQGIELAQEDFSETVSETSKVSGDIVMGVMLTGDAPSGMPPTIVTGIADQWSGSAEASPVCVRLVSKDGRYEAENTYLVGAGFKGKNAPFPYLGIYADFLESRAAVVLVTSGRCGERSVSAIPALWKAPDGMRPDTLQVYLNTAGNPASVAVGRGDTFFEPCTDISELTGLKYTTRCTIPVSVLPKENPARLTFFVTRSNTEETFTFEVLPIFADG